MTAIDNDPATAAEGVDLGPAVANQLGSANFFHLATRVNNAASDAGYEPVSFRAPPKDPTVTRSITRHAEPPVTVAVRLWGRHGEAVLADMVDGVVAANLGALDVPQAPSLRRLLDAAASPYLDQLYDPKPETLTDAETPSD